MEYIPMNSYLLAYDILNGTPEDYAKVEQFIKKHSISPCKILNTTILFLCAGKPQEVIFELKANIDKEFTNIYYFITLVSKGTSQYRLTEEHTRCAEGMI